MKRIVFILLIIRTVICVNAQEYFPFPDTNAIWSVNIYKFSISGDTVINNKTYKKYYRTTGDSVFAFENASYYAAVREDSNKKIRGIKHDSQTEYLLYDFSLEIGDSVYVSPFENLNPYGIDSIGLLVLDTDSVLINETYRKRYKFTTLDWNSNWWTYEYWIEGIGSDYGLFSGGTFVPGACKSVQDIYFYRLLCYQEGDYIEYFAPEYLNSSTCFVPVPSGIVDREKKEPDVKLFPNPVIGQSNLVIKDFTDKSLFVSFYNLYGQKIKTDLIKAGKLEINKDSFKKGIYLYMIESENKLIATGRFIVE